MKKKELPKLQFKKKTIARLSENELKQVNGGGDSVFYATTGCATDFTRPRLSVGCATDFTRPGTSIIIMP